MKASLIVALFFSFLTTALCANAPNLSATDTCQIPTLITPNEDGKNDELLIPCLPVNPNDNKSELYIFNEWGDRVAYYKPYLNDWGGTYSSRPLPDGTYFYIFSLTPTTPKQRGYITIFR